MRWGAASPRLARPLVAKSGAPAGWTWRLVNEKPDRVRRRSRKTENEKLDWLMWSFRVPPAPYRERPLCAWARLLPHLRPASLPVRLPSGFVGSRREPECRLARDLRGRLGLVDGAKRSCARPQAPTATPLRPVRRAALENRRGRSPGPAVPGVARAPPHAVAIIARLLGRTELAGHQSRRAFGEMRRGSTVPSRGPGQCRADGRSLIRDPARWPHLDCTRLSRD